MAPCLFPAGTLTLFIGVSHRAHSQFNYNTYLHLKVNKFIEFFIVKLEKFCIWEQLLDLLKNNYIHIRIRGLCPRKLVNFLCELMYFYWKISNFGNFPYTAQANQGGPRLYQGGRAPPGPTLATALVVRRFTAPDSSSSHMLCVVFCFVVCASYCWLL